MADTAPNKRRVKNPETFRERAAKAGDTPKPARVSNWQAFSGGLRWPLARLFRPLRQLGATKPLRLVGKILVPAYFRNSWRELKLVTWPSWRESRRLTFAVLVFAVIFGAAIAIVDYGLDKLFKDILLK